MKRRVTLGHDVGDGILITVRVRPRSRPGIAVEEGTVVVSVASPPIEGRTTEEARRQARRRLEAIQAPGRG